MTLARVAARLATTRSPEHRWRQFSVPLAAFVFMLSLLSATALLAMVQRQEHRDQKRLGLYSATPARSDLFMVSSLDRWKDRRISVVWIEPADPGRTPVLPPGMTRLPTPGQAVVSPGLSRLIALSPGLADRYRNRTLLGTEGVRNGGELLAYVRAQENGRLDPAGTAVRIQDGKLTGTGPAARLRGFGDQAERQPVYRFVEPFEISGISVSAGVLGVLVLPGLIVLLVGLSTASDVRDHRFAVLHALGAPTRSVAALAVIESLLLAVPGLIAASLLWMVGGSKVTFIPVVGYQTLRGDLRLPFWLILAEGACAAAVVVLAALIVARLHRRRAVHSRPQADRRQSAWRLLPAMVAVAAFAGGRVIGSPTDADLYLLGVLAVIVATPLLIPGVLQALGALIARINSGVGATAGRTMQWDPAAAARPFLGACTLIVLALIGTAYLALARFVEEPPQTPAGHAIIVAWVDPQPSDVALLTRRVGTRGTVVPIQEGGASDGAAGTLTLGATCPTLAAALKQVTCMPGQDYELTAQSMDALSRLTRLASDGPAPVVRLAAPATVTTGGKVVVFGSGDYDGLDEQVRTAALRTLTAPYVYSEQSSVKRYSPLVSWIAGGGTLAVVVLATGCLLALVDRLLAARDEHRMLLNLGMSVRQFAMLSIWMFAAPFTAVAGVALITGVVVTSLVVLPGIAMPWAGIGLIALITASAGFVGALAVAALGARSAIREAE